MPAGGRTATTDGPKGRSHHNRAFSSWLAGAGVKGGTAFGATDDFGREVVENPVHVHDFHATILHLLGFDHEKLTFRQSAATSASPTWPGTSSRSARRFARHAG